MLSRLRYKLEHYITSIHDDNATFKVRKNGKIFYIEVMPSQFLNSPSTTKKYLSYLKVLQDDEEDENSEVLEEHVLEWILQPFEPFFVKLAPSPEPEPETIKVTLHDYFHAEFFMFHLDIIDEELRPRQIEMEQSPYMTPGNWIDEDFCDSLETWTRVYDPAAIVLSFDLPEDALFLAPGKVLINAENSQTECFFKPCHSEVQPSSKRMRKSPRPI